MHRKRRGEAIGALIEEHAGMAFDSFPENTRPRPVVRQDFESGTYD